MAVVVLSTITSTLPAFAQWSSDPAVNLAIGDRTGEQTQSKIRRTADGGAYVSWFDNSTGGYDVYLQRLDKNGVEQWAHNGVLVADRGYSSTQDYGLAVDGSGNALITYRDDRAGGSQIGVNLVSPSGTLLWGAGGVVLPSSTNGNQPRCAALTDGTYAVSWSGGSPSTAITQRLDVSGTPLWTAPGVVISEASRALTCSDIQPGTDGSVLVLWVRCSGTNCILSNKHLYMQRIASDGSLTWNSGSPLIVFSANSIQNGTFPTMIPDGDGGAVISWYETGGSRNALVQHVDAAGTPLFPANGAAGNTTANVIRISASADYDPQSGETVMAWTQANSVQSMWGIYAQKFDSVGNRIWGDNGVEILPLNTNQSSFVRASSYAGGGIVSGFDARSATTGVVIASRLDPDGLVVWSGSPIEACSFISGKSRLDVVHNGCDLLMTWGDSRTDPRDIYVQNVKADGTFGVTTITPGDLNCSGAVDLDDLDPFVTALLSPDDYAAQHPCCSIESADVNLDTLIDGADVAPFVDALLGI